MTRSRLFLCCLVLRGIKPILTFPKGRDRLLCFVKDFFSQSLQPPLVLKPILTFPKRRNELPCFVKDFSKSIQSMNISPHLTSPEGEGLLLCFDIDW